MGGRSSAGGNKVSANAKATENKATSVQQKNPTRTVRKAQSTELEVERNMPQVSVTGIKNNHGVFEGKLDTNKSLLQVGDSFGIRVLGMRNSDVYGRISKVTNSSITITTSSGSKYTVPINKVEVNGRELRFRPKDKNSGWFAFIDLKKYYTADDFKKK